MPFIFSVSKNTCTFNNNKLFKKFREKLAVTPGAILHAYLHRFMRKWKLTVILHTRMRFILPPTEGIRNSNGIRGSKRRQFPRGWGQILKVFFSRDFETRIIVFIDDLTFITV